MILEIPPVRKLIRNTACYNQVKQSHKYYEWVSMSSYVHSACEIVKGENKLVDKSRMKTRRDKYKSHDRCELKMRIGTEFKMHFMTILLLKRGVRLAGQV